MSATPQSDRSRVVECKRGLALRSVNLPGVKAAQWAAGWRWRLENAPWRSIVLRGAEALAADVERPHAAIRMQAGALYPSSRSLVEILGRVATDPSWPAEVAADVARWALATLDSDIVDAFGGHLEWVEVSTTPPALLDFCLIFEGAQVAERCSAHVQMSVETLVRWISDPRWRPIDRMGTRLALDGMHFGGDLVLGESMLTLAELNALAVGDAVLVERRRGGAGEDGHLQLAGLSVPFAWVDREHVRLQMDREGA